MRASELVEILGNEFGREKVLVHSEFHIQVKLGKKPHDVWMTRFGEIKWRLSGSQETVSGNPHKLVEKIKQHSPQQTDFANMQTALALSRSIGDALAFAAANAITKGIFCDAGFKDGKARISVIKIDGEYVSADAQPVEANDIANAESIAIERALKWFPDAEILIYSDAKNVVEAMGNPRVKWISRKLNKPADRLANLRKNNE